MARCVLYHRGRTSARISLAAFKQQDCRSLSYCLGGKTYTNKNSEVWQRVWFNDVTQENPMAFSTLWMCFVITFGLCARVWKQRQRKHLFSLFLSLRLAITNIWLNTERSLTGNLVLKFNISSKLLPNRVSSSVLEPLQNGLFLHLFLHELPPPLHRLTWWCSPTVTLPRRFLTQNRTLTLAVCSSRPGFWNLVETTVRQSEKERERENKRSVNRRLWYFFSFVAFVV